MANVHFNKPSKNPSDWLSAIPEAAITDVRLAYKLKSTDSEVCQVAGDNDTIAGFPVMHAASTAATANEAVKLERGIRIGIASAAMPIGSPFTAAASGKLRVAVIGTDKDQGEVIVPAAADGDEVTVRLG